MNKNELITLLTDCHAIQFGRFILTSGAISDYYVDIKNASTNPTVLQKLAHQMASYTKSYDILAGMELGAVPLVVALSLETQKSYVLLRKKHRGHGTKKQIEGGDVAHKKVLLIEDVTTSGGSVIKSVHILREHNAQIDTAVVIVDRESGAQEKLTQLGITLQPLLTISDILKRMKKKKA